MNQVEEAKEEAPKKSRLAELRAQIAATEDEEKERIERIEEAMLEVVVEAQAKVGASNVRGVCGRRGFIVVTTPKEPTFRKYSDLEKQSTEDMISLLLPCVYPQDKRDEVEKLLRVEIGLLLPACNHIADLAGIRPQAISGKSKS